ncbi:MAG: integrase arm-type DNA-binding domain-containing protein [Casimicrobiaceae bacterium]
MWDASSTEDDIGKPHPREALDALKVKRATKPGRYADGNGLYLLVDQAGAKRWILRTLVHGKRTDMGLGSARLVSLAEARERARKYRLMARDGEDPIAHRRQSTRTVPTFKEAAEKVHASHSDGWKNVKHRAQWINTLETYAYPEIGNMRVNKIAPADVLRALSPIWTAKPETARRVRQRIGTVLDWATAAGHRDGVNPVLSVGKGLPKQTDDAQHHAALPYADVPGFVVALRASTAGLLVKLALEFLILNASRTGEVLGAHWSEFDADAALWVIPGKRMKAKKEHRVPLGARSIEILEEARKHSGKTVVFQGVADDKALSNMAFLMALRRMETGATRADGKPETYGDRTTAHGFRSAFRDWAGETTSFPREVCEAALAHGNKDVVEAAYLRTDFFEKRRALMGQWAEHVCTPTKVGKVHTMQRRKTAA